MVRLLKLPKIINITNGVGISLLFTYFGIGKRENNKKIVYSFKDKIFTSLIRLIISVIFIVYFLGCAFFWFQSMVNHYKYSENPLIVSERNFESTYIHKGMEIKDIALRSTFFISTTISTIGYGDLAAQNIYEMSFMICVICIGATIFAYVMGRFNNLIRYYNDTNSGMDYLGNLNSWLDSLERIHGRIPRELKKKIRKHFTFYFKYDRLKSLAKSYWDAETPKDLISINQHYVNSLPEETYYQILYSLFKDFFYYFESFGSAKLKYAIIPHLQPRKFEKDEYLYFKNKHVRKLLFIMSGDILIQVDINGERHSLNFCTGEKVVLGVHSILTKLKNRFDYIAKTFVESFVLNYYIFLKILDHFFMEEKTLLLVKAVHNENSLKRLLINHLEKEEYEMSVITEVHKSYSCMLPRKIRSDHYSEDDIQRSLITMENQTYGIAKSITKAVRSINAFDNILKEKLTKLK